MNKLEIEDHEKLWASKIIEANDIKNHMEDVIQRYWTGDCWFLETNVPVLFDIRADSYDNSIELDVAYLIDEEQVVNFCKNKLNDEFCNFIFENGVSRFWVNLYENENNEPSNKKLFEFYSCKGFPPVLQSINQDFTNKKEIKI